MSNNKKTLLISGIICLMSGLISVLSLCLDIFDTAPALYAIVMDSINIALSITTGTIYLCVMNKSNDWLTEHRMLFVVLMFVNILNGIIPWLVAFWVEIVITEQWRVRMFKQTKQSAENNGDITLHDDDYEVTSKVDYIKSEIEKLDELKRKHVITDEEYERMRQEIITKNL